MAHRRGRLSVLGQVRDQTRTKPGFVRIASSFNVVAESMRRLGLTVVLVVGRAPAGFEAHWRVVGGGGKIFYFSRKAGSSAIYLSRDYLRTWDELSELGQPSLFGRDRRS